MADREFRVASRTEERRIEQAKRLSAKEYADRRIAELIRNTEEINDILLVLSTTKWPNEATRERVKRVVRLYNEDLKRCEKELREVYSYRG